MKKKIDSKLMFCVFLTVLAFFLCAHGFGISNLIYSGESLALAVSENTATETASGSWMQPFYFRVRGGISSPFLVGLLSFLFLIPVCFLTCTLLNLDKKKHQIILACGLLVLSPAVLSVFCAELHTADASFLSIAVGTLGAFCFSACPLGWIAAAVFFGTAASLSFEACAWGPMFLAIVLYRKESSRSEKMKFAASCLIGAVLYTAGLLFFLRRYNIDAEFNPLNGFSVSSLLSPICSFFQPFTAYQRVAPVTVILLLILSGIALLQDAKRPTRLLHLICLLMILLILSCIPEAVSGKTQQVRLTDSLFALAVLLPLLSSDLHLIKLPVSIVSGVLCGVIFLGQIVFDNQVYLKKNLEFQSTLSVMTRVLDRLENTEGYFPGSTPVAFLGTVDSGVLSFCHTGFESLECFDAARNHLCVTDETLNTAYFWQILGYPVSTISDFERDQLRATLDLSALDAFPAKNCITWAGDVLVMKLSE